jgi:hypothetical protein
MSTIDHRFHRVSTGLKLVYTSLVLAVLTFLGMFFLGIYIGVAGARGPGIELFQSPVFLYGLIGVGYLGNILAIVGKIFCLDVPEKVKATGLIYAAVALTVVGLALGFAKSFLGVSFGAADSIASLLTVAGYVCFLVFLGRLAEFLNDSRQVARARFVLTGSILTGAIGVAYIVGLIAVGKDMPPIVSLALFVVGIFALILFVSYANLLNDLRRRIDSYLVGRTLE